MNTTIRSTYQLKRIIKDHLTTFWCLIFEKCVQFYHLNKPLLKKICIILGWVQSIGLP